jgi:hypothetical protein
VTQQPGSTTAGTGPPPVPPQSSASGATGSDSTDTRSLGAIVGDISADLSALVRQEMDLARTEIKQEVTKAGKGAGMFGGAGIAGHLFLWFLSLALTFLLDNWMPLELAALITAVIWAIVAGVLALRGRQEMQEANPQLPKTQQSLKEDAQWVKAQKN